MPFISGNPPNIRRLKGRRALMRPSNTVEAPYLAAGGCENRGSARLADAELAQAPTQSARVHSEHACGAVVAFDLPVCSIEHPQNVLALHFLQRGGSGPHAFRATV